MILTKDEVVAKVLKLAHESVEHIADPDERSTALAAVLNSFSRSMFGLTMEHNE